MPPPNLILPSPLVRAFARPAGWFQNFLDLPIGTDLLRMAGRCFFYDSGKARCELEWAPRFSAQQAIEDAYRWYKSEGKI